LLLCLLFSLVHFSVGHICSIFPLQRGPMSISTPGDDSCYRRTLCGGVAFDGRLTRFLAGQSISVLIQQNLNHWYPPEPGFLDVSVSSDPNKDVWLVLATIDDFPGFDMVTQTNFTIPVTLPKQPSPHSILRLRYQSNNPAEKDKDTTIFYNCADIELLSSEEASEDVAVPVEEDSKARSELQHPGCRAPTSWEVRALETSSIGTTEHRVVYDWVTKFVRWERHGNLEPNKGVTSLLLITNYTSGIEYVIDPDTKVCLKYGADAMYPWGYGLGGMAYEGTVMMDMQVLNSWANPTSGLRWLSTQACLPYLHFTGSSSTLFFDHKVGPVPGSSFIPPSYCNK